MSRINLDTTAKIWRSALPRGCNKLVLQAFAHHINSDEDSENHGLAWPSKRVALMCGMAERTVQVHVRALQTAGLLRPRLRTGRTTLYQVNTAALVPLVFPRDTVELDDNGNPVDNSALPRPAPLVSAETLQESGPESAENDKEPTEICTLKLELKLESKLEDSPVAVAPASPVPPYLLFEEVKPEVMADFAACRKAKFGRNTKSKLTAELINSIRAEATIAGMTLQAALEHCCHPERRWASFKAEWFKPKTASQPAPAGPVKVWQPDTRPIPPAPAALATPPAGPPPQQVKPAAPEVVATTVAAYRAKCPPAPAAKPASAAAPAMPSSASDINIAADAPPWATKAVELVNRYKSGQHVNRFALETACHTLKISPSSLRRAGTASAMH